MKKQKKKHILGKSLWLIFLAALLVAGLFFLPPKGNAPDPSLQDTQGTSFPSEVNSEPVETTTTVPVPSTELSTIDTKYCVLAVPTEYTNDIRHQELIEDRVALELFSTIIGDKEIELFRIYFGDESTGTLIGYLVKETETISVSYDVCYYDDSFFENEEMTERYYKLMEGYVAIMDSIYDNSSFSEEKPVNQPDEKQAILKYWSVELIENMNWEEIETDSLYQANFYGTICGEEVLLYSIGLGEMQADYSIGAFLVNGAARSVYLKVHTLPISQDWTEAEINEGYRMLETLNKVTDAIMSSENYSEETPK